jgi:hypothetical protein
VGWEDLRALEVFRERGPEVGILEETQVLRLGRIGGTDPRGLDGEVGLPQTTAREELFDCR